MSDDGYTLRRATNADAPAVRELVFSVLREYGLSPDPQGTDVDLADLERSYLAGGGSFDIMLDPAGSVVGSVGVWRIDAQRCEIRKMYLHASHRGRGLGRLLLERAIEQARQGGFKRIELETAGVLREAIGLYRSRGFKPFVPDHLAARCDQAYFLELT